MSAGSSPSFSRPPLDEVVLGVQFQTAEGYNTTFNGDIWNLFRDNFPIVEEQPPLQPQIEAFGGNASHSFRIDFGEPAAKTRLWFISKDHSHLIQHQEDRMLMNWRNRPNGTPYPRHAVMANMFRDSLTKLGRFYEERLGAPLRLTQAEVSYINIIPMESYRDVGEWLGFLKSGSVDIEGLNANFGQVLYDDSGQPVARMYYELQSVFKGTELKPALRFGLTCRGRPKDTTIAAGLEFITYARDRIVDDFCRLTTEQAQSVWERE